MAEHADYVMVGSVAKIVQSRHTVLGSGIMTADPILCATANWRWVRGPLTRRAVKKNGGHCPEVYGDPALLLPRIVAASPQKKHALGIVPHYVDHASVRDQWPDLPVINVLNADPREVIREITQCEKIISSSLHGIVVAHAYGIPAAWVKFGAGISGDDSKFHDHHESLGISAILSSIDDPVFTLAEFDDTQIHQILATGDF
jgi:hypothetical protein